MGAECWPFRGWRKRGSSNISGKDKKARGGGREGASTPGGCKTKRCERGQLSTGGNKELPIAGKTATRDQSGHQKGRKIVNGPSATGRAP